MQTLLSSSVILLLLASCARPEGPPPTPEPVTVRVALFNVRELSAEKVAVVDAAGAGADSQLRAAARVVQKVRPEILVLQEVDAPPGGAPDAVARRFAALYLATGESPIDYPYAFSAASNTGLLTGLDLDGDGTTADESHLGTREHGTDSYGFGTYPGQYATAVLSQHPIDAEGVRTFQNFLWRDLPGHHLPSEFYSEEAVERLRLSSKSHWDLPVRVADRTLHLLVSHPTPPGFDGDEDRNGRRNFDEIRFWKLYLDGSEALYDDAGLRGGLAPGSAFVLAGDLNAAPLSDASVYDGQRSIEQLLGDPRLQDTGSWLTSEGAVAGLATGPPEHPERSTAEFFDGIRIDYLLPNTALEVRGGGVFWPDPASDPEGAASAAEASDHRLVWLDVELP